MSKKEVLKYFKALPFEYLKISFIKKLTGLDDNKLAEYIDELKKDKLIIGERFITLVNKQDIELPNKSDI